MYAQSFAFFVRAEEPKIPSVSDVLDGDSVLPAVTVEEYQPTDQFEGRHTLTTKLVSHVFAYLAGSVGAGAARQAIAGVRAGAA
jgi:hypothetical protein